MGRAARLGLAILAIAALAWAARAVDWSAVAHAARGASPSLLAAAALASLAALALRGVGWWVLLRAIGHPPLGVAVRATIAGAAINNLVVASGGDAARVVFLSRSERLPLASVAATLVVERLCDVIGFLALLALGSLVYPLPDSLQRWRLPAAALAVALVGGLALAARRAAAEVVPASRDAGWLARSRASLRRFVRTAATLGHPRRYGVVLLIAMVSWALQAVTFALVARASGAPLPVAGSVATVLAVNVALIVRATPGNVGVFQVAYVATAAAFGAPRAASLAAAVLIQLVQMIPALALGALLAPGFVLGWRRHEDTELRSADEPPRN